MTVDFCRHMTAWVDRAIIIYRDNRGPTSVSQIHSSIKTITIEDRCWIEHVDGAAEQVFMAFLQGIDAVVGFETFYKPETIPICARQDVKTILFPMWECTPVNLIAADHLICLSDTDLKEYPYGNAVRASWPVSNANLDIRYPRLPPRHVVHNAGSGGLHDRNNTEAVVKAFRVWDRENVTKTIRTHEPRKVVNYCQDKILPFRLAQRCENRNDLYQDADLIIHLQAFDGLSLPLLEAAYCRVPALVLDIPGYEHYPKEMRIEVAYKEERSIGGKEIIYHRPNIEHLCDVLDDLTSGRKFPLLPPPPASWIDFEDWWCNYFKIPEG